MQTPRDFQIECRDAVLAQFASGVRSTLGVAATGLGKSFISVMIAKTFLPKRTIYLAHRGELLWQARETFLNEGLDCDMEKAELAASTGLFNRVPVVLATVQTLSSGKTEVKRMHRFNPMDFGLLIYDESHHAVARGNKAIVNYFLEGNPELKVYGTTATPSRHDSEALNQIFETVAFNRDILWGVDNGWLVEPIPLVVTLGALDLSHVTITKKGDFNEEELAKVMEQEEPVLGMVQPTLEAMYRLPNNSLKDIHPDKWENHLSAMPEPLRTIVFTVSVKQAEMLSGCFNRAVPWISNWVCGKTNPDARRMMFEDFNAGKLHILVNVGVATEGFDSPGVGLIVMGRPTLSETLYRQMVGRGTRPLPGRVEGYKDLRTRLARILLSKKPNCVVLDFAENSGRLKLMSVGKLLGGKHSAEAIEKAMEWVKTNKSPMKVRDVIAEEQNKILQEQIKLAKAKEEAKKARLVAKVNYTTQRLNPFDQSDTDGGGRNYHGDGPHLSPKQIGLLLRHGINTEKMPYQMARMEFNKLIYQLKNNMARPKQVALLKKWYPDMDYQTMTATHASNLLDALKSNRWRRVNPLLVQPKK